MKNKKLKQKQNVMKKELIKNKKKIIKIKKSLIYNVMDEKFTIDMKNGVFVIEMEKNEKKRKIKMKLNRMWYG